MISSYSQSVLRSKRGWCLDLVRFRLFSKAFSRSLSRARARSLARSLSLRLSRINAQHGRLRNNASLVKGDGGRDVDDGPAERDGRHGDSDRAHTHTHTPHTTPCDTHIRPKKDDGRKHRVMVRLLTAASDWRAQQFAPHAYT